MTGVMDGSGGSERSIGASTRPKVFLTLSIFTSGVLLAGAIVALVLAREDAEDNRRLEAARVATIRYLEVAEPLARKGGEVVSLGLKPGITELQGRDFSRGLLRAQTAAWVRDLKKVRDQWAQNEAPIGLRDADALFVDAMDGYVDAAKALKLSVSARASERAALVAQAIRTGEVSDRVWDRAAFLVQQRVAALGLDSVSWLPSRSERRPPSPSPTSGNE